MIQRIQTVHLILAAICLIACTMIPLGYISPVNMGVSSVIGCLGLIEVSTGNVTYDYFALPLVFIILSTLLAIASVFMYNNRKKQAKFCYMQIAILIIEMVISALAIYFTCLNDMNVEFKVGYGLVMPVMAIIFILLAHKGIMDDEKLIRSIDRIR